MHRFSRIDRDESGIAMIVAMLVVFVVVLLSIVIMDLSIHNTNQAAYDRKRVTSVAASESGIDKAWNLVQYTPPEGLPCGAPETGSLGSAPGPASYSIDFDWLDATGAPLTCPLSQLNVPSSVLVTSTGTINTNVPRTMEAYMSLAPSYGGFDAAIVAVTNTTFNNNFTITGSTSNNGDVYVLNGDLTISNAPTIYGNVYVQVGSASMSNNSSIVGNLWANNGVTVTSPASVTGDVSSSTSSLSGTGTIGGDATAGTTIAASLNISGTEYANSPQGPPPTQTLPKGCQVAIAGVCNALPWTGYTITTFSGATACTAARTFLTTGTITGDQVVWIDQVCNLAIANNDVINFTGNLAIVTQGSITMNNHNDWNGVAGKKLMLMVNYRTIFPTSCSSSYNITTGNNSNFVNATVLFYSPCTVTLNNQNNFAGQVLANSVIINNHFTLDATRVDVAGLGDILGFDQSIVYLREVVS